MGVNHLPGNVVFTDFKSQSRTAEQSSHKSAMLRVVKRTLDLLVIVAAAPAVLVVVGVAGLAILVTSGRPIFFIQERVGMNGCVFRMIKLRTMYVASLSDSLATAVGDKRVTPIGAILRRYRIDELPQVWNVLAGEMSLIGPRPEQPALVELYRQLIVDFDRRHLVKPGISGLAQVMHGYAADAEETRIKLKYDCFYVENASLKLDAQIVIWTILTLLRGTGAR